MEFELINELIKVSIPSERESISKAPTNSENGSGSIVKKFQFPPNGKAYPKPRIFGSGWTLTVDVSIPSERESISKGGQSRSLLASRQCFNSLRTGKHIQSKPIREVIIKYDKCFNSLRTGKHIQSFHQKT